MNYALASLGGAFLVLITFGIGRGMAAVLKAYRAILEGLKPVKRSAEVNEQLVKVGNAIALELSVLRTLLSQQNPGGESQSGEEPARPVPSGGYPFPAVNYDLFKQADVPDAKEEDTVLEETTDEDMVNFEKLESVREKGFEVEEA